MAPEEIRKKRREIGREIGPLIRELARTTRPVERRLERLYDRLKLLQKQCSHKNSVERVVAANSDLYDFRCNDCGFTWQY